MKLSFFDARIWRYIVSSISKIIEEGVFVASEEGFSLRAMDPSHVVMVDMFFPKEAFDEYNVEGREEIGVNFEDLGKILRRATKEDKLVLETSKGRFSVIFDGRAYREFVLPVLDLSAEELPEPKLSFKSRAKLLSDVFRDLIKDLEPISDILELNISQDKLLARARSDIGEAEVVLTIESGAILDLNVEEESRSSYSLDYFVDISTAAQAADTVVIELSSGMPVKVEYELPQGSKLAFYIAPRVE